MRKLPRRVGDILKFGRPVKLTKSKDEGVTQNSRFLLVAPWSKSKYYRSGIDKHFWVVADPESGKIYESRFWERSLVKDVFMTKVYRASRGFYPLKTKEKSE